MRRNTADDTMIREFEELKKVGITNFFCTVIVNGKYMKPVMKHTAQGVSAYANRMYCKYGDAAVVVVDYMDQEFNLKTYCTYRA